MAISMLKIRRPLGRLIFNMGIAIPGKTVFLIETAPRVLMNTYIFCHYYIVQSIARSKHVVDDNNNKNIFTGI